MSPAPMRCAGPDESGGPTRCAGPDESGPYEPCAGADESGPYEPCARPDESGLSVILIAAWRTGSESGCPAEPWPLVGNCRPPAEKKGPAGSDFIGAWLPVPH